MMREAMHDIVFRRDDLMPSVCNKHPTMSMVRLTRLQYVQEQYSRVTN
jgi:hypothetical protein